MFPASKRKVFCRFGFLDLLSQTTVVGFDFVKIDSSSGGRLNGGGRVIFR